MSTAGSNYSEERTMIALRTDLKRLGAVKAPSGFADRVLAQVGMTDSYAAFETVLGTVYVAWNRLGVSAAARSESAEEFEAWFRKDVGRHVMRAEPWAPRSPTTRSLTSSRAIEWCAPTARSAITAAAGRRRNGPS